MAEQLPTYYDVLKVERTASADGIRRAYRRLAQQYHPDRMPDHANAGRAMAAINAAYAVLSDSDQRARHDRWIQSAESRPMPLEPVRQHTRWQRSWPWYLLTATIACSLFGIVGTTVLTAKSAVPASFVSSR